MLLHIHTVTTSYRSSTSKLQLKQIMTDSNAPVLDENGVQPVAAQEAAGNGVLTTATDEQRLDNTIVQINGCQNLHGPSDVGTIKEMLNRNPMKGMIEARHELPTVFKKLCSDEEARVFMLQLLTDYVQERGCEPSSETDVTEFHLMNNPPPA